MATSIFVNYVKSEILPFFAEKKNGCEWSLTKPVLVLPPKTLRAVRGVTMTRWKMKVNDLDDELKHIKAAARKAETREGQFCKQLQMLSRWVK